jgi:radical SAM protein with 4Fe4S-binding SPASM domain
MSCLHELWGLEFSREDIATCRDRQGLLSLELELTRACNLQCIYCYNSSGTALKNELTREEIFSIIDQAAELGARKIIVLGGGEPLIYQDIFAVLEHIVNHGMEADIFTNGTLITPEVAQKLHTLGVAISLKMNSLEANVQDLLAGKKGAFAEIHRGLAHLLAAGYPDDDHILGIESIICSQNYDEIPTMWRWARERNIIPYFEVMNMQGRALQYKELEVDLNRLCELFQDLAAIDKEEFGYNWPPLPPLAASRCSRHEYSCTVTTVGNVYPCPGVTVTAGNIREQPLHEILQGSVAINELRNIRNNIKGRCATCDFTSECYGCRGNTYQVTGDYLAEDPVCWIDSKLLRSNGTS